MQKPIDRDSLTNNMLYAKFNFSYESKSTNDFHLNVDCEFPSQGITVIFGESGSGKTSLLRCIAGLEKAPSGIVKINHDYWQNENYFLPIHKRELAYVFQEASLFEHLTANANLNYAIKRAAIKPTEAFVDQVIDVLGIGAILDNYPSQLSGGERQRVAIARALLIQPKLLLMDEPLASLDSARKQDILPYLERLRSTFNIPILYVTHSINEVIRLADYALIMQKGKVIAKGTLTELFARVDLPLGVSQDLGAVLECEVLQHDHEWGLTKVAFDGGKLWLPSINNHSQKRLRVRILANDISVSLVRPSDISILNVLEANIANISQDDKSGMSLLMFDIGSSRLIASLTAKSVYELGLKAGSQVWAMIKSVAIVR